MSSVKVQLIHVNVFKTKSSISGKAEGSAANCGKEEFCSHPKENKSLEDYILYLKEYRQSGYSDDYPCLYLKDWHFTRYAETFQSS